MYRGNVAWPNFGKHMAKERISLAVDAQASVIQAVAKNLADAGHVVYAGMPDLCDGNKAVARHFISFALRRNVDLHVVQLDISSKESCHVALDQIKLERGFISTVIGSTGKGVEIAPLAKTAREELIREVRSLLSLRPDGWPSCVLIHPELVKATAFYELPHPQDRDQSDESRKLLDLARLAQSASA
jgi:hypothetical protein